MSTGKPYLILAVLVPHLRISLREFHDSIEEHIRSLASLGKSQESYGALLVTIILGLTKIRQNLARAHRRQEWKID